MGHLMISRRAGSWGQMRASGFSFFSVAFCFCWRAASLDFIAAIAHCVPTNTDAMVFIMGKPTFTGIAAESAVGIRLRRIVQWLAALKFDPIPNPFSGGRTEMLGDVPPKPCSIECSSFPRRGSCRHGLMVALAGGSSAAWYSVSGGRKFSSTQTSVFSAWRLFAMKAIWRPSG